MRRPIRCFVARVDIVPANKLILRLQPNEGIVLKFGMKTPGPGFDVKQVMMDFSYDQLGGLPTGDAYARLIEDCIQGDPTLFTQRRGRGFMALFRSRVALLERAYGCSFIWVSRRYVGTFGK